jgi:hypothetical protein
MEVEIEIFVKQAVSKQDMAEVLPKALQLSASDIQEIHWLSYMVDI